MIVIESAFGKERKSLLRSSAHAVVLKGIVHPKLKILSSFINYVMSFHTRLGFFHGT